LAEHPLTRVVWIDRNIVDVARSMKSIGMEFNEIGLRNLMTMRQLYQKHFDLVIQYEALRSGDACCLLWEFCLPGVPFDWAKWGSLQHKKIGYSKQNPMPEKSCKKFLGWAQQELDDLKMENTIKWTQ
jgi:hypothetical protein